MRQIFLGIVIALVSAISVGCSQSPDGFPALKPCEITITDGTTPIEGVTVQMIPKEQLDSIFISGITNSGGIAVIKTTKGSYGKNGAPEGDYTIILSKSVDVQMPQLSEAESNALTPKEQEARQKEFVKKVEESRMIPEKLSNPAQTPLSIQVNSGNGKLSIDIAQYKNKK